jgi:hypothetical protein
MTFLTFGSYSLSLPWSPSTQDSRSHNFVLSSGTQHALSQASREVEAVSPAALVALEKASSFEIE